VKLLNTVERRKKIIDYLIKSKNPTKGNEFSEIFNVSRQVIVQDIAVLRAQGYEITATPQGYIITGKELEGFIEEIVSKHETIEDIREELNIVVDNGGEVIDVTVDHPFYGEFNGKLMIKSRLDVKNFLFQMEESNAEPLSKMNDGIHLHKIKAPSKEILEEIKEQLKNRGFLVE
jgi:transcriptional regulator of NAD metabolism